jgi:CBS domain-containing protein
MKVGDLMTKDVRTCFSTDSLNRAAQIMWENDCGCVPIVNDQGNLVGILTDRDICMAAYTQGRPLTDIACGAAASVKVTTVKETDSLSQAEKLMHDVQVRRLPVVDDHQRLVGLLSIGDLARRAREIGDAIPSHIVGALVGISQRRTSQSAELKKELKKSLALLQTLRDEVRIRLHLGSLDLKDQWKRLEPRLGEVEKRAEELTEASFAAVADAVKRVEHIRSTLSEHR